MSWSRRQYLIAFNMVSGIGGRRLVAIEEHFVSLETAWHAGQNEWMKVAGIGPKIAGEFFAARASLSPQAEEAWAHDHGAQILTLADSGYPPFLRRLGVPPPVLYVVGQLPDTRGIAVVGTRKPSKTGIAQARQFSAYLVSQDVPVISGLARGIDYYAHERVVHDGGVAVAVLGSNLANLYPREHKSLAQKIVEKGALITEFSSRCATVPGNFPRRNRVIAGLSRGVLVVQAGIKSGTLHTADWALELGLEVWAIPGEITDPLRQGTHRLIKQGAALVTDPVEMLQGQMMDSIALGSTIELSADQLAQLSLRELYQAGIHTNEIAATLDRPIHEVLAEISLLQLEKDTS